SLAGNWRARARRRGTERWVEEQVRALRDRPPAEMTGPAVRVALHREGGAALDTATAAVELINLLRPVVAICRFVVFTAMALARHPQWQQRSEEHTSELQSRFDIVCRLLLDKKQ